jgi:hypothetical protein
MKVVLFFLIAAVSMSLTSCRAPKGCPVSGRSIGAEKVLSGDAKTMKALKRAPKFKS